MGWDRLGLVNFISHMLTIKEIKLPLKLTVSLTVRHLCLHYQQSNTFYRFRNNKKKKQKKTTTENENFYLLKLCRGIKEYTCVRVCGFIINATHN